MPDLPDFGFLAVYDDGSALHEYVDGRHVHGFGDVDLARVAYLGVLPLRDGLRPALVPIDRAAGMRPIFFRSHCLSVSNGAMPEGDRQRGVVTCLGWQKTLEVAGEARNVASYTVFCPDGRVLITDDRAAIDRIAFGS